MDIRGMPLALFRMADANGQTFTCAVGALVGWLPDPQLPLQASVTSTAQGDVADPSVATATASDPQEPSAPIPQQPHPLLRPPPLTARMAKRAKKFLARRTEFEFCPHHFLFQQGCRWGDRCWFSHDDQVPIDLGWMPCPGPYCAGTQSWIPYEPTFTSYCSLCHACEKLRGLAAQSYEHQLREQYHQSQQPQQQEHLRQDVSPTPSAPEQVPCGACGTAPAPECPPLPADELIVFPDPEPPFQVTMEPFQGPDSTASMDMLAALLPCPSEGASTDEPSPSEASPGEPSPNQPIGTAPSAIADAQEKEDIALAPTYVDRQWRRCRSCKNMAWTPQCKVCRNEEAHLQRLMSQMQH
jgi:hypothetical protein